MKKIPINQYYVAMLPIRLLRENDYKLSLGGYRQGIITHETPYIERTSDNSLFRQIRIVTGKKPDIKKGEWIDDCIYIDIAQASKKDGIDDIEQLVKYGAVFNGKHYLIGDRSGSMARYGAISMISADIWYKIDEIVAMGIDVSPPAGIRVPVSKWLAYRGLMLSSCKLIEEEYL